MDNKEIDRRIKLLMSEINALKKEKEGRPLIPLELEENASLILVPDDLTSLSYLIRRCLFAKYSLNTRKIDGSQYLTREPVKKIRLEYLSRNEYEAYCFAFKTCFYGIVEALSKIRDTEGEENVAETDEQAGHGAFSEGEPG
jgi:hypothetical protein